VCFVAGVVLTASHLTRRFDSRVAVEDLSFELAAGEIFALLGPNGAGKTTTLRMLAGLIVPSSGTVHIDGEPMSAEASHLRGRIGFLTEAPGLWDRLTVYDNLVVYARLHGVTPARDVVNQALELFGIANRAGDQAAQLSKGLKQRVALARTLLHNPSIVLLDEPTAGLDPESAHETRALILRLRNERRSVVISTHNLDEVERVADRVAVLRSRLIALDTPDALRSRLFGRRVSITLAEPAAKFEPVVRSTGTHDVTIDDRTMSIALEGDALVSPGIVKALVDAGARIVSVIPEERSLEEVYLRLLKDVQP
jgi:ABC-2 type transport system ATP-binding protein